MLSASGIAFAIPCYLFYMYLASRARKLINNVERAGLECVHIIADAREEAEAARAAEPQPVRRCCCSDTPVEEKAADAGK